MDVLPIVPLALLLDLLIGDPDSKFHPVRQIGHIMDGGRRTIRSLNLPDRAGGIVLTLLALVCLIGGYLLLSGMVFSLLPEYVVLTIHVALLYLSMSFRSMFDHALNVILALRNDQLDEARESIHPMIRRDPDHLDIHGIARAAIEGMADGFVDSFLTPLFWFCAGALAGLLLPGSIAICGITAVLFHRTIHTLDDVLQAERPGGTMGWFSSLLHTFMNFLPTRLAVPFLFISSLFTGADTDLGGRAWLRDRHNHRSLNSGQAKSFVAGALHVRLGGPNVLPNRVVEQPWVGEGTPDATEVHVKACVRLVLLAGAIALLCAFLFLAGVQQVQQAMLSPF